MGLLAVPMDDGGDEYRWWAETWVDDTAHEPVYRSGKAGLDIVAEFGPLTAVRAYLPLPPKEATDADPAPHGAPV